MATPKQIAELDFAKIKAQLIEHIKNDPTFTDYDFEGSALNVLMDALAYNTHYLGYYANMLHNESFVDTAQKRASLVSRAKELGYTPLSTVASTAIVDIQVFGIPQNGTNPFLPRGTTLTSRNENGSFTFFVNKDVNFTREIDGDFYRGVELKEGIITSNRFIVDFDNQQQIFTIPNKNVDLSSLKVFVRDSSGAIAQSEYVKAEDVFSLRNDSRVYFVQESYDEFFQIYFGDDVLGKRLPVGAEIDISYIVPTGPEANGCFTFNIPNFGISTALIPITTTVASGGKEKETLEELRRSLVKTYAAQNRVVTPDDYFQVIKRKVPSIRAIKVWGGEDNIPAVYGVVFISLLSDGAFVSEATKNDMILPELKKLGVLTVTPRFVDPVFTKVGFTIDVRFNRNNTTTSDAAVVALIEETIKDYFSNTISSFGGEILYSDLIGILRDVDPGITSLTVQPFNSFELSPLLGVETNVDVIESNYIERGSISSTTFRSVFNDIEYNVKIKDNPARSIIKTDRTGRNLEYGILEMVDAENNDAFIRDVGTVIYDSGKRESSGRFEFLFSVSDFIAGNIIKFYYNTSTFDILSARNQILLLDTSIENVITNIKDGLTINLINV